MSGRMKILSLLSALVLVNVLLLAPGWVRMGGLGSSWLVLEAALIIGLFSLLPARRWTSVLAVVAAVVVVLLSLLAFGDVATRQSLARPLNLYLDLHLLSSVHSLLTGTLGSLAATVAMAGAATGAGAVTWLLAVLLSTAAMARQEPFTRAIGMSLVGLSGVWLVGPAETFLAPHLSMPGVQVAADQTRHFLRMLDERERFDAELAATPDSYADVPGLLDRLEHRDVLLAFVESYGVAAVSEAPYAATIRPRLEELAGRMAAAGLHLASGTMMAPTQGGQSWFSHGSLLSGAWLDNQLRYDLLLAAGRQTLIDDFRNAGYRTVAVMPAITLAWPEGERLGYDRILAHSEIDYAGPPLNWVTMPDQFTWSFLQRVARRRAPGDSRPVFAQVGLISSHAPWTPILPVLDDWEAIGDGAIFAPWEHAGERPSDLWQDSDRIRQHYALSVDYAIHAMTGYAERYVDDRTLLIVLGDHQAAPVITGEDASHAVPVHVISGDAGLVQPFLDWGFEPGAFPNLERAPPGMDAFRDWFVRAFSATPTHPATAPASTVTSPTDP